jgi:hypothetical protein
MGARLLRTGLGQPTDESKTSRAETGLHHSMRNEYTITENQFDFNDDEYEESTPPPCSRYAPHQEQEHHHGLETDDEHDQSMPERYEYNTGEQEGHEVPIEGKHSRGGRPPGSGAKNMETEGGEGEMQTHVPSQRGRSHEGGQAGGYQRERGESKGDVAGGHGRRVTTHCKHRTTHLTHTSAGHERVREREREPRKE